jgi:two-component system, cell cycle sensor histidine kinase PleC
LPLIGNAKRPAACGRDLCCLMSEAADKPEAVQLPAEPPIAAPVSNRIAALRVREARHRLTSTSGTRPAFDREALHDRRAVRGGEL